MRVHELLEQVVAPSRPAAWVDENAWAALVASLIAAVREEERTRALDLLDRLALSAAALKTPDAVARLIAGVATREYRRRPAADASLPTLSAEGLRPEGPRDE